MRDTNTNDHSHANRSGNDLNGLVLSGGFSLRMGSDKGEIHYHGMSQRRFLFQELQKYCVDVFSSCRNDQSVSEDLNPLRDEFELPGPLNGILSAFRKNESRAWLVVAIDMPYVNSDAINELIRSRNTASIATCFQNQQENFPEPLLTIWEPQAFPLLMKFYRDGGISPRQFLTRFEAHRIIPSRPEVLMNINSPSDYEDFKASLRQG